MKFVVSSAALYEPLQAISRVINPKSNLPILDCFLLSLEGNKLMLTAADNEVRLETFVEVSNVEGNGKVAINAKNLLDPLRELPNQPLTIDINDETLEVYIYYYNGKYNFVGLKGDEYPQPKPLSDSASTVTLDAQVLFEGINRSLFAAADDDFRPVMSGIFFDLTPEDLTFVASDGHKLVRIITKKAKGEADSSFILPKKPANLLKSLLPRESGEVIIKFDENNAYITTPKYTMVCRFVEGRYPNYNSVIPQNNPNHVVLDRLAFLSAMKRVSVFSDPSSSLVKLQFSQDKIVASAQNIDYLTAAEEIIPCNYEGNAMNIGFRSFFLIDILNNIPSTDVRLELSDPSRACIILPAEEEEENEENEDMLVLLMPMMLNE